MADDDCKDRYVKVVLEQSGGLAGLRRPPRAVSSEQLSPADAAQLVQLVEAAAKACHDSPVRSSKSYDAIEYFITVEDGDRIFELNRSDANMVQPYADLKRWIEVRAG
jgi:hypothetical protein